MDKQWICRRLIKSATIHAGKVPYGVQWDNNGNSIANTCPKNPTQIPLGGLPAAGLRGMQLTETKTNASNSSGSLDETGQPSDSTRLVRCKPAGVSALSAFDGSVVDYRGCNG